MSGFEFVAWDGQEYPQPEQKQTPQLWTPFPVADNEMVESKSDPAYNTAVQFINVGEPRYSNKDYGAYAREGYSKNPVVYRVINLVARTMAGIRWRAYTDERMKKEIDSHPLLDLWKKPNPRKARTRFLKEIFTFWQIAGNAYLYANRPAKNAPPQELWVLRPDRVKIVPGTNDIQEYRYGSNPHNAVRYDPRDVLHLDFINPDDDWYGLSPLSVVSAQVDLMNEGQGWNLALIQNGGRTSGVLVYPGQLREEQLNQVMRQIEIRVSGKRNAGRPLVLDNGVTYIEMGKTPMDMDWSKLWETTMRTMAAAQDVAPELVGDAAGKTFANVHEANQALYTEKALPMLDEFMDEINGWLCPMYKDPIYLAYDRADIEALAENKQVASTRSTTGWNSGKITLNEARKMEGEDALPGGDVLKLNGAIVPVAHLEEYAEQAIVAKMAGLQNAALAAQTPVPPNPATNNTPVQQNGGQQPQGSGNGRGNTDNSSNNNGNQSDRSQPDYKPASPKGDKASGEDRATKVFHLTTNEDKAAYIRDMEADRERWTGIAAKRVADYFAMEHKAVVRAVKAHPVVADLPTTLQNTVDAHSDRLKSELVKLYQDIGHDIGGKVMDALIAGTQEDEKASGVALEYKAAPTVSMVSESIVRRLLAVAGTKVKGINETTMKMLRVALAEGVADGESIPQLASRIDTLYLDEIIPNRSTVIARTEVLSSANGASHEAASQFVQQTDIQLTKQWLATGDNRTRPTHVDADGQEVGLDEYFEVGGSQLMFPGDPNGASDEVIMCRCTQVYSRVSNAGTSETIGEDDSDLEEASNRVVQLEEKRARYLTSGDLYREHLKRTLAR